MQRKIISSGQQDVGLSAPELARNLARKLRYLRAMRGWTQVELSRRSGMGRAYLSRLERSKGGMPRYINLVRLAACLGVAPAELVGTEVKAECIVSIEPL